MIGAPVVIGLAGRSLKFRRLSVVEILSIVEDAILEQKREKIKHTADMLPAKERSAFIIEQGSALPEGYLLEKEARTVLADLPDSIAYKLGWESIKDNNSIKFHEWVMLFDDAEKADCVEAFRTIMGKGQSPDGARSSSKRKSTDGRRKQ